MLSTSGSLAETFGTEQPFRYRGYVYDEETGWYYLQSRYYNPELGRFISADVYLSTGQGVLGHNAYAYCGNNPTIRVDIEGDWWQVIAAAIGAVVNVTSQLITDVITSVAASGEVHLSSWQTCVGAAIGGAAEGFVLLVLEIQPLQEQSVLAKGLAAAMFEDLPYNLIVNMLSND